MFEKTKEQKQRIEQAIADFEESHAKIKAVHTHVAKHRGKYGMGIGIGATALAMRVYGGGMAPEFSVAPAAKNTMLMSYKSAQTLVQKTIVEIPARADRGHIVIDAATGLPVGGSLTEAAINEGISRTSLLNNTRGLTSFAPNGKQYIDLGENLSEMLTREVSV